MSQVIDSHAVFVYLEKEPGYQKVTDIFARALATSQDLLMTTVNWGEIYYITRREHGIAKADDVLKILEGFPIEFVNVDQELAKQAGIYKSEKKMSYADCFAAALAKLKKASLITGDKEFREVEKEIKIHWI